MTSSVGTKRTIDSVGAKRSTASSRHLVVASSGKHTVLKELPLSIDNLPEEDVTLYAKQIGIDPNSEPDLLWIAKKALTSNLPDPWIPVEDPFGRLYYYNSCTLESSWEHPSDSYYRSLVERQKRTTGNSSSATLSMSGLTSLANLQFIDDEDMLHNKSDNDINDSKRKSGSNAESKANKAKKQQQQKKSSSDDEVESVEFELDADAAFDEFSFDDDYDNDERELITLDVTEGGIMDTKLFREALTIELNTAPNYNSITSEHRNQQKTETMSAKIESKNKIESQTNAQSSLQSSLERQSTNAALNTKEERKSRFANNNQVFGNDFSLDAGDEDPFAEFGNNERNANDLFSTTTQYKSNASKQTNNSATKPVSTLPTNTQHILETVEEMSEKDEHGMDSNETASVKDKIGIDIQHFNLNDNNADEEEEYDDEDEDDGRNGVNAVEIEAKFDEITALLNTEIVSLRKELREEIRKQRNVINSEIEEQMSDLKAKLNQNQTEMRETNSELSAIRQHQHQSTNSHSNNNMSSNDFAAITANRKDIDRIYKEMQALRSDVTDHTSISIRELRSELTREIKTKANNTAEDLGNKFMEFKDETHHEMRSIRGDIANVTNNNKTNAVQATQLRSEWSEAMLDVERHSKECSKRMDKMALNYDKEMENFNNDVQRLQSLVTLAENKIRALEVSGDEIRSLAMKENSSAQTTDNAVVRDCYSKIDDINKQLSNLKQQVNDIYNIIDLKKRDNAFDTFEVESEPKNETRVVINESNKVEKSISSAVPVVAVAQNKYDSLESADTGLPNRISTLENSVIKICDTLEKLVISPTIVTTHRNKTENSRALKQETNTRNRNRAKVLQYSDTDYNNDDDDYVNRTTSSLSSTSLSELRAGVPKISRQRRKFKKRAANHNPRLHSTSLAKRAELYEQQHNCCLHNNYYQHYIADHKNYPFIKVPLMTPIANPSMDSSKHKLRDIRASSSSLLNLIKKTTKKLKEEASELESMGKYHFITDFKPTLRDDQTGDETAIQKLISVRSDVTDKLKKLTNAINQQKSTII